MIGTVAFAVGTTQADRAMILIEENLTGSGGYDSVAKEFENGAAQPSGINLMVAGDVDDPDASWAQRGFRRPCLGHTDSVDCHAHPVLQFEQFIEGLAVGGISSADEGGAFQIPDVVANVVGYGGSEVAIDPTRFHHEGVEGRLVPDDLGDRGEHPGSSETGPGNWGVIQDGDLYPATTQSPGRRQTDNSGSGDDDRGGTTTLRRWNSRSLGGVIVALRIDVTHDSGSSELSSCGSSAHSMSSLRRHDPHQVKAVGEYALSAASCSVRLPRKPFPS